MSVDARREPQHLRKSPIAETGYLNHVPPIQEMAVLTLDENGTICESNQAGEMLFGPSPSHGQHISSLIPRLKRMSLLQKGQINPKLSHLSHVGHHFEIRAHDGEVFNATLFMHSFTEHNRHFIRLIIIPVRPS